MIFWKSLQERDTRPFAQITRYGVVGVSATILHVSIFSALSLWINPAIDPELGMKSALTAPLSIPPSLF